MGFVRCHIRIWFDASWKKAAMLCTASVEEVIDKHYQNQIDQLDKSEKELKNKIIKFREDELHHKDIAYEKGATKKLLFNS
jgi:ubiquinone biosynthesis monooxygenase Coq7